MASPAIRTYLVALTLALSSLALGAPGMVGSAEAQVGVGLNGVDNDCDEYNTNGDPVDNQVKNLSEAATNDDCILDSGVVDQVTGNENVTDIQSFVSHTNGGDEYSPDCGGSEGSAFNQSYCDVQENSDAATGPDSLLATTLNATLVPILCSIDDDLALGLLGTYIGGLACEEADFKVETLDSITVPEAGSTSFTVTLSDEPATAVTATFTSDNPLVNVSLVNNEATGTDTVNAVLTSTSDVPIYVFAAENADDQFATNIAVTVGGDERFTARHSTIAVDIADNDIYSVTITPTSATMTEGGTTSYDVYLGKESFAPVVVTLTSEENNVTLSQSTLTFPPGSTGAGDKQSVTVTAKQDADADNGFDNITHTVSSADGNYNLGALPTQFNVTINDDESAVLVLDGHADLSVVEGGDSDTYTLKLGNTPTSDVTVHIESPDGQVTFSATGTSVGGTGSGATLDLVFDDAADEATITVSAVDDDLDEDATHSGSIQHTASSGDSDYNGQTVSATVTITDNDATGILFVDSDGDSGAGFDLNVTEGGADDTYTVSLTSAPVSGDVVIDLSHGEDITVGPAQLVFGAGNFSDPQTVTVTAVDDDVDEDTGGDEDPHFDAISYTISAAGDAKYAALTAADHSVQVTDNDEVGVSISDFDLEVYESGAGDVYSIVLDSAPEADVTVDLTSGNGITVSPESVIFTSGNWNQSIEITVNATDDNEVEGTEESFISHRVASSDQLYDGFFVTDVDVTVLDDDFSTIELIDNDGDMFGEGNFDIFVSESGATDQYLVSLGREVEETVVLRVTHDDQVTVTADPPVADLSGLNSGLVLVFGPEGIAGTDSYALTVAAVDDSTQEAIEHTGTILHALDSELTLDEAFEDMESVTATVDILENDVAALTITETDSSTQVKEGDDGDSFDVALASAPSESVVVFLSWTNQSSEETQISLDKTTLTFTPENYGTAQTVTVTAVDDLLAESDHPDETITFELASAQSQYNGLSDSLDVQIIDNDVAGVVLEVIGDGTEVCESATCDDLGNDDYVHLQLAAQPLDDVVVNVTIDDATEVAISSGDSRVLDNGGYLQVTFTTDDFSDAVNITVSGVDDAINDGNHTFAINASVLDLVSSDDYDGLSDEVSGTTFDDADATGIVIKDSDGDILGAEAPSGDGDSSDVDGLLGNEEPSSELFNITVAEGGETDTYTVALTSEPTSDVHVVLTVLEQNGLVQLNLSSADSMAAYDLDGSLNLTFSPDDYDAITVLVTADDDDFDEDDGDNDVTHVGAIAHSIYAPSEASEQPYGSAPVEQISTDLVSIVDNDESGIVLSGAADLSVSESGDGDQFTVTLASAPAQVVTFTIAVDGDDIQVDSNSTQAGVYFQDGTTVQLNFTDSGDATSFAWDDVVTINVTAIDDRIDEDADLNITPHVNDLTFSITTDDEQFSGLEAPADQSVSIIDDDEVDAIVLDADGDRAGTADFDLLVNETGDLQDEFSVVLDSEPHGDVTVTLTHDGDEVTLNQTVLTFTADNWDTPQFVNVTAYDDEQDEDPGDNDVVHTTSVSFAFAQAVEVDGEGTYTDFALADLIIDIIDNDEVGFVFDDNSTVVVSEADGPAAEDPTAVLLGDDPEDCTDGATQDCFNFRFDTQPKGDVTVTVTTGDDVTFTVESTDEDAAGSIATDGEGTYTFTVSPTNWQADRIITVSAIDDEEPEGDEEASILFTASSNVEGESYNGVSLAATVLVKDDDLVSLVGAEDLRVNERDAAENGDSYQVVLAIQPDAPVVIEVYEEEQFPYNYQVNLSSDGIDYKEPGGKIYLTFSESDWDIPQTVSLRAIDDKEQFPLDPTSTTIGHRVYSADQDFEGDGPTATVTILDNDPGYITVEACDEGVLSVTEGGATDCYDVVLHGSPLIPGSTTGLVAVEAFFDSSLLDLSCEGCESRDIVNQEEDVPVDQVGSVDVIDEEHPGSDKVLEILFVFDASEDNEARQQVLVTAVDDDLVEADGAMFTIDHEFGASTDPNYAAILFADGHIDSIDVTVDSDDVADFILITSGGSTAVTEGGSPDTYALSLTAQPTADVTVALDAGDEVSLDVSELVFTADNWAQKQTVTITAVDDDIDEATELVTIYNNASSEDSDFDQSSGFAIDPVLVTVTDDDTAGFEVRDSSGDLLGDAGFGLFASEDGATDSFSVVLTSEPTADVTFALTPDSDVALNVTSLVFTADDWSTPQDVTVSAVDDSEQESDETASIGLTATSSDADYDGATTSFSVDVKDNDVSIIVDQTALSVSEDGATSAAFQVGLTGTPAADVVVSVTIDASHGSQATLSSGALTFPAGSSTAQQVTLTAVDDAFDDGDSEFNITVAIDTTDPGRDASYDNAEDVTVAATVVDDDVAEIIINATAGTTVEEEGSTSITYEVSLNATPTDPVIVAIGADDTQVTLSTSNLVFPAGSTDAQTVTVTAVDDDIPEGDHSVGITHEGSSADAAYHQLLSAGLTVNIVDNDLPTDVVYQAVDDAEEAIAENRTFAEGLANDTYNGANEDVCTGLNGTSGDIAGCADEFANATQTGVLATIGQLIADLLGLGDQAQDDAGRLAGETYNSTMDSVAENRTFAQDTANSTIEFANTTINDTHNDVDSDRDMIPDDADNCPAVPNQGQDDADSDGLGDACDDDADGDGYNSTDKGDGHVDPDDSDASVYPDADNDGVGDREDTCAAGDDNVDSDGDGTPDACDTSDDADNDGDGFTNQEEMDAGSDKDDASSVPHDHDGDGYNNTDKGDGHVDPNDSDASVYPDADNDGVGDREDICDGDDNADLDGDGIPDACDDDADGDGYNSTDKGDGHVDPDDNDASVYPDADNDGVGDRDDVCPNGSDSDDADGDGIPDGCDDDSTDGPIGDSDNDTIPNAADGPAPDEEADDTDGDMFPDSVEDGPGGSDYNDSDSTPVSEANEDAGGLLIDAYVLLDENTCATPLPAKVCYDSPSGKYVLVLAAGPLGLVPLPGQEDGE